jgi:hypothetical protein
LTGTGQIEREHNTPTPGKSPPYRARIRATSEGPAILLSASNFGSVTAAKYAMDNFLGALAWREAAPEDTQTRFIAIREL